MIKDFPKAIKSFSDEAIAEEMFSDEVLKDMMPGAELIESKRTKYDGQPGALSIYVMLQERAGMQILYYQVQHVFLFSKKLVSVQCMIGGVSKNIDKIQSLYFAYFPLFMQIGNSVVIHDKWEE